MAGTACRHYCGQLVHLRAAQMMGGTRSCAPSWNSWSSEYLLKLCHTRRRKTLRLGIGTGRQHVRYRALAGCRLDSQYQPQARQHVSVMHMGRTARHLGIVPDCPSGVSGLDLSHSTFMGPANVSSVVGPIGAFASTGSYSPDGWRR
jgi:hypothetical protein